MLHKIKNRKQEGFTIIEVLIVLAIAGLILLIVFLAVPALQRNARNTTLKNDAQSFAGAISEYESNNAGIAPASIATPSSGQIVVGAASTSTATAKINGGTAVVPAKTTPSAYKTDTLYWNTGTACDGTVNPRAVTVYYYPESSSKPGTPACIDAN